MAPFARLIREPLVHFVAAGAILFAVWAWLGAPAGNDDDTTIVVDRRALLTFLQYRANAFETGTFAAALDGMTDADLDALVSAYVDEEILYREAGALGLDDSDNIIRQRMVQKMSFVLADIAGTEGAGDEAELERYFAENREAYSIEPWVTFTHVFFDADRRGRAAAAEAAREMLSVLNETGAGFNDAPAHGDSFPFLRNYVERTLEYVTNHFGQDFADEIAGVTPSPTEWQGPFDSAFGTHVVLLTAGAAQSYPELAAVRTRVEQDYARSVAARVQSELIEALRQRYRVDIRDIREDTRP